MAGVSRITRLGTVFLALAILTTACASKSHHTQAGAADSSAAPSGAVVVKTFSPYAATGTLAVPVADQLQGYCWTGSIAVPKAGTYRCLVGNAIYDPCFAPATRPAAATVACVSNPWSPAHVVTLTKPLPTSVPLGTRNSPWALELANSARCVIGTGTVPVVDGVPLSYECGAGVAAGGITNDDAQMTVNYGSETGGPLTLVPVTTAWRA